jgi:hypothetical protein
VLAVDRRLPEPLLAGFADATGYRIALPSPSAR